MGRVAVLKIRTGDFSQGFDVLLQIWKDDEPPSVEINGWLSGNLEILGLYELWRSAYVRLGQQSLSPHGIRLDCSPRQITNCSISQDLEACRKLAEDFTQKMILWLRSGGEDWQKIREELSRQLGDPSDEIRVIIQPRSENPVLWKLPWHEWDLFQSQDNPDVEIALSPPDFRRSGRPEPSAPRRDRPRILAVLGDSTHINLRPDIDRISRLKADTEFLTQPPELQQLCQKVRDTRGWDIFLYSGHSQTKNGSGLIYIKRNMSVTVDDFRHALGEAIRNGLKLAIFNSCDGLGLVRDMAQAGLHLPVVIVMREKVPDLVAQDFLKEFLNEYASGQPLYTSVRRSRQRLEDHKGNCPGATWLPVIWQNPAVMPPTWAGLNRLGETSPPSVSPLAMAQDPVFFGRFNNFWIQIENAFGQLLAQFRQERNTPAPDFQQQVEATLSACRIDVRIPLTEEIEARYTDNGDWETTYGSYLDELRTDLTQRLQTPIDNWLNGYAGDVKSRVANVLVEAGLGRLTDRRGAEFLEVMVGRCLESQIKLRRGLQLISGFSMSYALNFQERMDRELDTLTLTGARRQISNNPNNAAEIQGYLRVVLRAAIHKCEEAWGDLSGKPNQAASAVVAEFIDQALRAEEVKEEWQNFLYPVRSQVWPAEG